MINEVTLPVPLALQKLILANNDLLRQYQQRLVAEVEEANYQMMQLLRLDPIAGWKLDMERMVYTRPKTEEEQQPTE